MLNIMTCRGRGICFCLAAFLILAVSPAWGYEDRGRNRREKEENPRKEQLRQEAQESVSEVKELLTQILQAVNKNQPPQQELISQAVTMIEENKHFVLAYEDDQKAQYMLLQAWTDYYQGNLLDAMNWSLRACKMDASNGDAWISQAVFCQLNGKRPLEPRIRKPDSHRNQENGGDRQPRRRRENEAPDNDRYASASEPYGRKGTLDFNLSALRKEMLKERFGRIEYRDPAGKTIEYKPGGDTLCIFFWQIEPIAADANDLPGKPATGRLVNDNEMMNGNIIPLNNSQNLSLSNQGRYFGDIYEVIKDHPQITCFSLNTNGRQDAEQVATGMDETVALEMMRTPGVYASDPASGAGSYVGLEAQVPFVLIADKEGIVRYAGPAADFMPAFVLTHLTGVEISLNASEQSQAQSPVREMREDFGEMNELLLRRVIPERNPNKPTMDPNVPIADPNVLVSKPKVAQPVVAKPKPAVETKPAAAKPKPAPEETVQYRQLPLEEDVQAQKELVGADTFMQLAKKRGLTYKRGVDMCRAIIKKYPGTQYEHEARELLKQVPEHKRGTYNITDEELGL